MIKCTFPTKFFRDLFFVLRKKGKMENGAAGAVIYMI